MGRSSPLRGGRDVAPAEADRPARRLRAAAAASARASSCRSPTRRRARASRPREGRTTRRRPRARAPTVRSMTTPRLIGNHCRTCSTSSSGPEPFHAHTIAPFASRPICPSAISRFARFSSTGSQQRSVWPGCDGIARLERRRLRALRELVPAARAEVAAGRAVVHRGRHSRYGRQALGPRPVHPRDRAQQAPRVRVLRVVEDLVDRPLLDDAPGVHDEDAVGDVGDDAEVVGHEHDARVGPLAQLLHDLQDLRLDRHVQRGRGLVGDEHRRVARERHRDHHALAHAARELVRVASGCARAPAGSRPARAAPPPGRGPRPPVCHGGPGSAR